MIDDVIFPQQLCRTGSVWRLDPVLAKKGSLSSLSFCKRRWKPLLPIFPFMTTNA